MHWQPVRHHHRHQFHHRLFVGAELPKLNNTAALECFPSSEPMPGFKLVFEFSSNDYYFENDALEKTCVCREAAG
jgi:hypothetical protein